MKDIVSIKKKTLVRKRTGISERPTIPYVRIYTPKKGKGAKNDRSEMKVLLRHINHEGD